MELSWAIKRFNELHAAELYELLDLRIKVFVVEQNCPYPETDGKDYFATHIFGRDGDGRVMACLRIVDPGIIAAEPMIGRIATAIPMRGRGIGHMIMTRAMSWIKNQYGDVPVGLSSQDHLSGFYNKHGFGAVSDIYLEDGIPHVEMIYRPGNTIPLVENRIQARRLQLAELWEFFDQAKSDFLRELEIWPPDFFEARPPGEGWNAAQVLEHIIESEFGTLSYIRNKTQNTPSELLYLSKDERENAHRLVKRLYSTERYGTPQGIREPEGKKTYEELAGSWKELRSEYRQFIASLPVEIYGKFIFRHPIAGPMGLEETLKFLTAHILHHRHQLERILAKLQE
jgi:ElaA protein